MEQKTTTLYADFLLQKKSVIFCKEWIKNKRVTELLRAIENSGNEDIHSLEFIKCWFYEKDLIFLLNVLKTVTVHILKFTRCVSYKDKKEGEDNTTTRVSDVDFIATIVSLHVQETRTSYISISECFMSCEGLNKISNALIGCSLHSLDFSSNRILKAGVTVLGEALATGKIKLKYLDLSHNIIRGIGAIPIFKCLPKCGLEYLKLIGCSLTYSSTMELLKSLENELTKLTYLDISNNYAIVQKPKPVDPEALVLLPPKPNPVLKKITFLDSLSSILHLTKLEHLDISGIDFSSDDFRKLSKAIGESSIFVRLHIKENNNITDDDIEYFLDCIKTHRTFEILDYSHCNNVTKVFPFTRSGPDVRCLYMKKHLNNSKVAIFTNIMAVKNIPRVGVSSKIRILPVELIRLIHGMLAYGGA